MTIKPEEKQPQAHQNKEICFKESFWAENAYSRWNFVEAEKQFSDGVGYEWIDQLKSLLCFASYRTISWAAVEFPYNPPTRGLFVPLFFISTILKWVQLKQ
jgi:hypothetical protein